jgi:transmembrane sensor
MGQNNLPWDAIAARLKNEANDEQLRLIKEWLDLSPENQVILSEISHTWSLTKNKTRFYEPDKDINWEKLMKRIGHSPQRKIQLNTYFRWIAAASVSVLVFLTGLGLGTGYFKLAPNLQLVKIISPEGSKTQMILPDGTHVWLNSGSELQYPGDFTAQNRIIHMKGECFFDVAKDPEHPFVVDGSKFRVKVYGTRFNVNESTSTKDADVTLISGKVNVYDLNDKLLSNLNPGQQMVFSHGLSRVQTTENPEALTSWINNILIFENKPFEEVIFYLEKWYGVKISLDSSLRYNYNYTFKVKTESLREVLELISFITPINYTIEGEKVTIKYKQRMKK